MLSFYLLQSEIVLIMKICTAVLTQTILIINVLNFILLIKTVNSVTEVIK